MATVLTRMPMLKDCGYDYTKVVHGEQRLTLHRPLPPEGELIADARVTEAFDKGPGKGAVIYTRDRGAVAKDNQPMFTLVGTTFARGDGGFGGPSGSGPAARDPRPQARPERRRLRRARTRRCSIASTATAIPLHADPELAKRVGFPVPILHGLCTYGTACRAILTTSVQLRPHARSSVSTCASRRPSIQARRSSPTCGSTGRSCRSAAG